MKISVNLYGSLRRFSNTANGGKWENDIQNGLEISEVISMIGIRKGEVAYINVNGVMVDEDYVIKENDRIILVTNVEGG